MSISNAKKERMFERFKAMFMNLNQEQLAEILAAMTLNDLTSSKQYSEYITNFPKSDPRD